jgi:hypothetical protein
VSGSKGTIKNQGKIVIPARTWKVAVILERDHGLADVHAPQDILEVIAVDMPNEPGIRNVPWETYKTTIDAIEASSGYDLLAALPDWIERIVEANEIERPHLPEHGDRQHGQQDSQGPCPSPPMNSHAVNLNVRLPLEKCRAVR